GVDEEKRLPCVCHNIKCYSTKWSLAQLVELALLRRLVVAPALELRSVADAVARDVVELDLADELRSQPLPHELLLRLPAARLAGAALAGAVRLEQLEQLSLLRRVEARAMTDHVELALVVVEAEDQRADRALVLSEPERGDHCVRRPDPLDLDHARALARTVRGVG